MELRTRWGSSASGLTGLSTTTGPGTSARTFSQNWIRNYEGFPREVAIAKQLNIFIGIDSASGKEQQTGKLDFTAGLVLGQTLDRSTCYLLDGFNEKLPADKIVSSIVDLVLKWRTIAAQYGGTCMVGVEENAYTNHLHVAIDYDARSRGADAVFAVTPLKHNQISKRERIRILCHPYSDGRILWPHTLDCLPKKGEPYDLMAVLRDQFKNFPSVTHDDLLDCHAYAYQMSYPGEYRAGAVIKTVSEAGDAYSRAMSLPGENKQPMHLSNVDTGNVTWSVM